MTVLFFLRRIGPYHEARFRAAARLMRLIAVETRPGSEEYAWDEVSDSPYTRIRFPAAGETGIRGRQLQQWVQNLMEQYRPDAVVTTGWADAEYHRVVLEASNRGVPRIVISDSRERDEPRSSIKEWIKQQLLTSYQGALVAGTESRQYLESLGFQGKPITQPWDVVDNNYYISKQNSVAARSKTFLCIARLIPEKDITTLIKSLRQILDSSTEVQLCVIGNGPLITELQSLSVSLDVDQHIVWLGFLQQAEIHSYLQDSVALILPSKKDTWGLAVNEAMAAGCPVIVSDACGCAVDLIEEGETGFTFPSGDAEALAERMEQVWQLSESERYILISKAQKHIQQWSLEAFAEALQDAVVQAQGATPLHIVPRLLHTMLARR